MTVKVLVGDCRAVLRSLPAESVHCAITSPPYYGLRDYGIEPSVWGGDEDCEHEWGEAVDGCFHGSETDGSPQLVGATGTGHWRDVTFTETLGWWPTCRCDGLVALPKYPKKPKREADLPRWRVEVKAVDADIAGRCAAAAAGIKVSPCTVLDPFGGAGTTGLVADRLQRDAVLVELNPKYAEMARDRINQEAPLFAAAE